MLGVFQKLLCALRDRNTKQLELLTGQTLDIAMYLRGGILKHLSIMNCSRWHAVLPPA